jgi:hypothetical protein
MATKKSTHRKKLHLAKKIEERKPLSITKHIDVSTSTIGQMSSPTPQLPAPNK